MATLPSFNYSAINAPGGIAAGLGGLSAALIQAQQDKRRMAFAEQGRQDRLAGDAEDRLMRKQQLDDIQASREAAAKNDARDFEYRKTNDDRNYNLADRNSMSLGVQRVGNAVNDFQRGGGLTGLLMGPPKKATVPHPNADVMPPQMVKSIDDEIATKIKDMEDSIRAASGAPSSAPQQPLSSGLKDEIRQKRYAAAGYNPLTMRPLGNGNTNAAGQMATPQQPPIPSQQPSSAPNQNAGQSDADLLKLKAQHPLGATLTDDEFLRRARAKLQGK